MSDLDRTVRVWDACVRLCHWSLVGGVSLAWLSVVGIGLVKWHEPAGYVALAAAVVRLIWGSAGGHFARFCQFVRHPRVVVQYLAAIRRRQEPRYLGHNPLGGWMALALLAVTLVAALSGWMFTTDRFWGVQWVQRAHIYAAWSLLALAVLHLAGVIFTSARHRENLVAAMVTGKKAAARSGDIP